MGPKAVLLYDGDCAFCQRWVCHCRALTGDGVQFVPYQEARAQYPQLSEQQCRDSVRLILPDGQVLSGAHAVFMALSLSGRWRYLLWVYRRWSLFREISESLYQGIATHRSFLSRCYKFQVSRMNVKGAVMTYVSRYKEEVYALMRIVAGFMFAFHGPQILFGWMTTRPRVEMWSQIWVGGIIELVCGALIMVGFKTRWAAFLSSGTMAVAYVQFHWKLQGGENAFPGVNQGELSLLYAFIFLYMACRGGGIWSFDKKCENFIERG